MGFFDVWNRISPNGMVKPSLTQSCNETSQYEKLAQADRVSSFVFEIVDLQFLSANVQKAIVYIPA